MSVIELLASSPAVFVGTSLVLALAVGSFLNVVIYRLPVMLDRAWREQCRELSSDAAAATLPAAAPQSFNLAVPRSACPACRAPITALQNIPLISWLVLRGRCANCGKPIERWQTGFYSRQELPAKSRTAVWVGAVVLFLLVVLGFARSCHWF